MSLRLNKELNVNRVCSNYGVILSSESVSCTLVFKVESVNISGTKGTALISVTVNGITVGNQQEYDFTYDANGGDVVNQVESFLLALSEFSGSVKD